MRWTVVIVCVWASSCRVGSNLGQVFGVFATVDDTLERPEVVTLVALLS